VGAWISQSPVTKAASVCLGENFENSRYGRNLHVVTDEAETRPVVNRDRDLSIIHSKNNKETDTFKTHVLVSLTFKMHSGFGNFAFSLESGPLPCIHFFETNITLTYYSGGPLYMPYPS
jgi:hypothetical protein